MEYNDISNTLKLIREVVDAKIAARRKNWRRRTKPFYECLPDTSFDERKSYSISRPSFECRRKRRRAVDGFLGDGEFHGGERLKNLLRLLGDVKIPRTEPRPPDLKAANLSFAARLVIAVRDKFNNDAPKVYTAANVSRQAYSQIISNEMRPVSKRTAIRFAFALKSTPEEAVILLKSAGYAFSNSLTEDFILQACLESNPPIWDLDTVNALLCEYKVRYQY
jgi:hypothetical protein